jgi:hypothetical protein
MNKLITMVVVSILLTACGAPAITSNQSISQQAGVRLVSNELVGSQVIIDGRSGVEIVKSSLVKYTMGVAGAADAEEEGLDVYVIDLMPGMHTIIVLKNGVTILEKELYLSDGQTKELRVK